MRSFLFLICISLCTCTFKGDKGSNTSTQITDSIAHKTQEETKETEQKKSLKKINRKKSKKQVLVKATTKSKQSKPIRKDSIRYTRTNLDYKKFHKEALDFCKDHRMNKEYYFLLDFSIPSGKNRFFIVDFDTDSIIKKRIVTHGACDVFEDNFDPYNNVLFSDRPNSHCSSKGKYKIGKRAFSNWGINVKYWIKGMDASNKSAEKRIVVLHSWDLVSDEEIYPEYSPLSWGCPAVSNNFMAELDERLKKSKRPVLLWIIE